MTEQAKPRIKVESAGAAKRLSARWRGLTVDVVRYIDDQPFNYRYRGPHHLLMAVDRAVRVGGETHLDGLPRSAQRDVSGKLSFVPAGHTYRGTYVPGMPPHLTCVYIDPATLAIDATIGFAQARLSPRLFFDDAILWSTVAKLRALVERPAEDSRAYAEALGAVLAIELMRLDSGAGAVAPPSRGGLASWQKRRVRDAIEGEPSRDWSLAELADLAGLSPTHFARAFKRSFGEAPGRYQLQQRIERAKILLADPSRSVTDVAFACGFDFPGNFSAAFRKVTGMAPSEFRRALH
jgi:AraC-like DNA-binding protein